MRGQTHHSLPGRVNRPHVRALEVLGEAGEHVNSTCSISYEVTVLTIELLLLLAVAQYCSWTYKGMQSLREWVLPVNVPFVGPQLGLEPKTLWLPAQFVFVSADRHGCRHTAKRGKACSELMVSKETGGATLSWEKLLQILQSFLQSTRKDRNF